MKTHVANVLAKLGVENRAQAAVQALKRGLIPLDSITEGRAVCHMMGSGRGFRYHGDA